QDCAFATENYSAPLLQLAPDHFGNEPRVLNPVDLDRARGDYELGPGLNMRHRRGRRRDPAMSHGGNGLGSGGVNRDVVISAVPQKLDQLVNPPTGSDDAARNAQASEGTRRPELDQRGGQTTHERQDDQNDFSDTEDCLGDQVQGVHDASDLENDLGELDPAPDLLSEAFKVERLNRLEQGEHGVPD